MTDYRKHPDFVKTWLKGFIAIISALIWTPLGFTNAPFYVWLIPCTIHYVSGLIYNDYTIRKFVRDHKDWVDKDD